MSFLRFIPTQVGNTGIKSALTGTYSVHPHTSGEYSLDHLSTSFHVGSSPHKWGIRGLQQQEYRPLRFIPTQVGNTIIPARLYSPYAVHPHTSGEYFLHIAEGIHPAGSSPHKWGIQAPCCQEALAWRFIPTQVGNTSQPHRRPSPNPVHPHTSGEYSTATRCRVE